MPKAASEPALPQITQMMVSEIIIPEDRQREVAKADDVLIASIEKHGLINPITVKNDGTLVAGERRLDAHKQMKLDFIAVRLFEELSDKDAFLIELQENIARKQLTWQEEAKAIHRWHEIRLEETPEWTQRGTATDLGLSPQWIGTVLAVAEEMAEDAEIKTASSLQGAFNLIKSRAERAKAAAQSRGLMAVDQITANLISPDATKEEKSAALLENLSKDPVAAAASAAPDIIAQGKEAKRLLEENAGDSAIQSDERILCADFTEWAANYTGPKFDVIHCDFPYGKGYSGSNTRKTGTSTTNPLYDDGADVLDKLLYGFFLHQDRFAYETAHCLFWFDMIHYSMIVKDFEDAGWRLAQPYPLIWTKDYTGVAADTKRRPRHCYETALLFSRGDRKLIKLDNDHGAAKLDEKLHTSQKPQEILRKFLGMIVDEHTSVLDPTCGSGSAIIAAESLGSKHVLGIELDQSNADVAATLINRPR